MTTDALASGPQVRDGEPHRLAGRLGPAAIVFMVVAAAAPLTVVAGTFPGPEQTVRMDDAVLDEVLGRSGLDTPGVDVPVGGIPLDRDL